MLESRFVCWLSYLFSKHMSAAGEECPIGMDTDNSVGYAIACAADPTLPVYKEINDEDDQTVGCTFAHATDPSRSDAENISDKDDDSL